MPHPLFILPVDTRPKARLLLLHAPSSLYSPGKKVKVKVQVYSLILSLKTYHPTLHLTPWSLDLFIREPFQLPRRACSPAAVSAH